MVNRLYLPIYFAHVDFLVHFRFELVLYSDRRDVDFRGGPNGPDIGVQPSIKSGGMQSCLLGHLHAGEDGMFLRRRNFGAYITS